MAWPVGLWCERAGRPTVAADPMRLKETRAYMSWCQAAYTEMYGASMSLCQTALMRLTYTGSKMAMLRSCHLLRCHVDERPQRVRLLSAE